MMELDGFIAACLVQHRTFGLFADHSRQDDLARFVQMRGQPLVQALAVLDCVELRNCAAGIPFLQIGFEARADSPVAGYYGGAINIRLDQLLSSRHMFWQMQLLPEATSSVRFYLLRAALWMLHRHDFNASVRYLLDLQRHGYLLDFGTILECLLVLCLARQRVATDHDIVPLFVEVAHAEKHSWHNAELRPVDLQALPVLRPAGDDVEYLVQAAESDIEEVRAAQTYDDWLLGQHYLGSLMFIVHFILRDLGLNDELAFVSLCARFEEISADSFAYKHMIHGSEECFPFEPYFGYVRAVELALKQTCHEWRDRLLDERVLVPDQLVELLLPNNDVHVGKVPNAELPPAWRLMSAAVAPVFADLIIRDPAYRLRRRVPMTGDDIARFGAMVNVSERGENDVRQMLAQLEIRSRVAELKHTMHEEAEECAQRKELLYLYPYCDLCLFSEALWLDRRGDFQAAMTCLERAILINPSDPNRWHSASVILYKLGQQDIATRIANFACRLRSGTAS